MQLVILPFSGFVGYRNGRMVRTIKRPLGVPTVGKDQSVMRRDNKLAHLCIDLFAKQMDHGLLFLGLHRWDSFLWSFSDWVQFLERKLVFCSQILFHSDAGSFSFGVIHNSVTLNSKLLGSPSFAV